VTNLRFIPLTRAAPPAATLFDVPTAQSVEAATMTVPEPIVPPSLNSKPQ
jgi:hypothetical protein